MFDHVAETITEIGAYEAKTHLPRLLERVRQGERFTITRHGVPIAELRPVHARSRDEIRAAIDWLAEFSAAHASGSPTARELLREARASRKP